MLDAFLITQEQTYSWDKFLIDLNDKSSYVSCYKYTSVYDYFVNFVSAIIRNLPIILVDSDISEQEILNLRISDCNKSTPLEKLAGDVIDKNQLSILIEQSHSHITLFTSGTTGQPKKVVHTPQTFIRSVRRSPQLQSAVWGYAYNPTHMAGLQVFFQVIINGASIVYLFDQPSLHIHKLIDHYSITHISATPTFYRLLLPYAKQHQSVVRVTFGGEKSTERLHKSILNIFPNARTNNIYASTEAGSLFSGRGNCFTIPSAIRDLVIIKDNELLLHKSLIGNSESLKIEGDYYATGDVVRYVDQENGIFEFDSRKNELINVGGYKVNPYEVEDAIGEIDGVINVMVYGKDNSVIGKILCAQIEVDENTFINADEIKRTLALKLQSYKVPRIIRFTDKLETTRSGKITRR